MVSTSTDIRFGVNAGRAIKVPVRAATTANIALSGEQTIDGVACVTDDRVLVKDQTTAADNGIYLVDTGTWTRSADFDGAYDVGQGTLILVLSGTVNQGFWQISTADPITIGTTSIAFARSLENDAVNISFVQSGSGAVATTAQAKGRERKSFEDFGAVGDGVTDDATAWATALAAMGSANFELHGTPGATYLIGAAGVSIANKTSARIVADGAKIKVNAVATQAPSGLGSTVIFLDTNTNVEFSGWEIDGNSKASNLIGLKANTECTVRGNRMSSGGLNGHIFANNNTRCKYLDNECISGSGTSRGIWLGNYATSQMEIDPEVSGNIVRSMGATGIVLAAEGGRCYGNHSEGNAGSGIIFGGASGFASQSLSIYGNVCRGNTFHGIQWDVSYSTTADLSRDVVVANNICEENLVSGIFAVYGWRCVVTGNICRDNNSDASGSGYGILIDELIESVVSNNVCYDSRSGGSRTQVDGIRASAGIASIHIKKLTISGNVLYNNTSMGLQITNVGASNFVDDVIVQGNICSTNGSGGMHVVETAAGQITGLIVSNNICADNTTNDLRLSVRDCVHYGNQYTNQIAVQAPTTVTTTAVGNVGTGEDNLQTSTVQANALQAAGYGLRIRAWGTTANTADAKTLKLYFGSLAISTQTLTVNQASDWEFDAMVISTGTDAQDYTVRFFQDGATEIRNITTGTHTQDDGAAITVKCTGEATTNNDIVQEGLIVERLRLR